MEIELTNQRALVTGASSGLGKGMALALGAAGARVAINYLNHPEVADAVRTEIIDAGGQSLAIQADVSNKDAVAAMFERIDQEWGGIDLLVNNAGIDGKHALSWECDSDEWLGVIKVNLFGTFHCSSNALRRMIPQKSGVILNITSVHEVIAWTGFSAYTTSKAGISMMTKTMAQEAAPYGVRVLALAPGAIRTPINEDVWKDPTQLEDLMTKIPLKRIGEVEDIAKMAVVLLSDAASYATGTTVFVDGGMTDYPSFGHGG